MKSYKIALTLAGLSSAGYVQAADSKPMNVIFMGVDDLRVQLHSYGFEQMKTPNFDRLAKMGVQFNRAYVQQAVCAASRASFLTGCRPDTTGVNYPYSPWFESVFCPQYQPVTKFFAEHGFYTRTLGKIHHGWSDPGLSEPHYDPSAQEFVLPENQFEGKKAGNTELVKPWEHADLPDNAYQDGQIADETIQTIRRAVQQSKPFFIAPGFHKPHLPFVCPKRYYDLYTDADIQLAPHPKLEPNQPAYTITDTTGASKWWEYPQKGIDTENAKQLIHSYYACVSFTDAQIGKVLDELEAQHLLSSTIIIVWSDHGYHLGDQGMWGKSTCFEWATRSPLFAYVPGMKETGRQTDALVEYVDLYPTLLELCGLKRPDYLEGTSFAPLLNDVSKPWKTAAFSQFPRFTKTMGNIEGYTVRTKDFRYTQWRKKDSNEKVFEELYDERENLLEAQNIAANPEFKATLDQHREILSKGWKAALPPGVTTRSDMPKGDDSWYYLSKENKKEEEVANKKKNRAETKGTSIFGGGKKETSLNKPYISQFFLAHPDADADDDGILTKEELDAYKAGKRK